MVRALERGLSLKDFEELTVGTIVGYIITYNDLNSNENDDELEAGQADYDSF